MRTRLKRHRSGAASSLTRIGCPYGRMCTEDGVEMVTVGLLVRLAAKPGREAELEEVLRSALHSSKASPGLPRAAGALLFPERTPSAGRKDE